MEKITVNRGESSEKERIEVEQLKLLGWLAGLQRLREVTREREVCTGWRIVWHYHR